MKNVAGYFTNSTTQAITHARQVHLASLGLDLSNKRVLEVGAGIGLHTPFFIDRGCEVVITDGNIDNVTEIKNRFPHNESFVLDLEQEILPISSTFDLIYSYGLFYHLANLECAIRNLAKICTKQILIETRVSIETIDSIKYSADHGGNNGSIYGRASRPSRLWMINRLRETFGYAYISVTQPNHQDFPLNWDHASGNNNRAIFVGSKSPLSLPTLSEHLLKIQQYYQG